MAAPILDASKPRISRGLGALWSPYADHFRVHYNLSFPDRVFEALQQHESDEALKSLSLQDYRSHRYFGLIRNFIRLTPLVMFLVGASLVCQCFMTGRDHHLLPLLKGTLFSALCNSTAYGQFWLSEFCPEAIGYSLQQPVGLFWRVCKKP